MRFFKTFCLFVACVFAFAAALAGCENRPLECAGDECEEIGEVALPLSVAATHVYTITSQNAPSSAANCNDPSVNSWCECGYDYTDNAARCNTASEVLMVHIPPLNGSVANATLTYQVSTWAGAASVSIRRILRPVTTPTMGNPGYCATGTQASWFRSGSQAWSLPGAAQDGTDRTAAMVNRNLPGNTGTRIESYDVTALVGAECSNGCVLAQYATGAHVSVLAGTVNLAYEMVGPPAVCGDGFVEGFEACDDGNATNGDGCSGCSADNGYTCTGEPSVCVTTCGDGVVAGAEECDLGTGNGTLSPCSPACETQSCTTVTICE